MLLYPPTATHFNPLSHPTPAQFLALLASLHHDKGRESSKILSTHKVLCPLLEYQITTQASDCCFWTKDFSKMPQAAATKLIFQSLLSWALPPLLSSEQPPPCSVLPLSLGINRQPFEKNLVANSWKHTEESWGPKHLPWEAHFSVHGQCGKFKPTHGLCKWIIIKIKQNITETSNSLSQKPFSIAVPR